MRSQLFLAVLMVSSLLVPLPAHADGRAIEFDIEVPRFDWLSSETVPMGVQLKNAQFNVNYTIDWTLSDADNSLLDSGSIVFKATGTVTSNVVE